jgi:hypothetical protein
VRRRGKKGKSDLVILKSTGISHGAGITGYDDAMARSPHYSLVRNLLKNRSKEKPKEIGWSFGTLVVRSRGVNKPS